MLDQQIESWPELEKLWPEEQAELFNALDKLRQAAFGLPGAVLELVSRPGVSLSLRFNLSPPPPGRTRPVFHLIDVVSFEDQLFLSVCYYEDEISDSEELGNLVPQGLFNEHGYCFDLDEPDPQLEAYLLERQKEAHRSALQAP